MKQQSLIRAYESSTATSGSTSQALLDRVRLGSDDDQRLLISLYSPLVLNFYIARRHVENLEDRQDITNRVFLTVFKRIERDGFEREASGAFRGWLKIITRNKVGDFIRRARRRKAKANGWSDFLGCCPAAEEGEDPDGGDEATERAVMVRQALEEVRASIEPASYEMAWLQLMEGRSATEAGAACGKSANSAYIAKSRVKGRLLKILGRFEIWDSGPPPIQLRPGARS